MKTKEKLERAGWVFKERYALVEVLTRGNEQLLLDEVSGKVRTVYPEKGNPYTPDETETELLCERV